MSSLIDSEAAFKERLNALGLSQAIRAGLSTEGFVTYGSFAYSFSQPGQKIDDDSFAQWVSNSIHAGARLADVAGLKRLLFEAHTYVLSDLRTRVQHPDGQPDRKIPEAERSKRLKTLREQMTGLLIEGGLEPSHALLDLCCNQHETRTLQYLAPEKCTSRIHEITHSKSPAKQVELEADKLVVKERASTPEMVAHTALQLQEALKRRGLAYQFANALTFRHYDRYLSQLFAHMHRDPPSGYGRVTTSQLVNADKLVFQKLIETGVQPAMAPDGSFPMDAKLLEVLQSYEVSFTLLPLPSKSEPKAKQEQVIRTSQASHRLEPYGGKQGGKAKGGKGGKKSKPFFKVPQAIHAAGGKGSTSDGRPICYNFNLEGCSQAAAGASCPKGLHVCAICGKVHSMKDHPKA